MNAFTKYIVSENDELKLNNLSLANKVADLAEEVGYLRGYIAGRDDACEIEEIVLDSEVQET